MPARAADGLGKSAPEEIDGGPPDADPRSVDDEEGAEAQVLKVKEQVAIQRDAAGDRERGQSRAVEKREALQLLDRKSQEAPTLDLLDEALELPPACLAALAELAGAQDEPGGG
ncbi:MAG TPA: hypothetical protein VGH25_08895, partial [Dongiaceae bacterium]